MTSQVGDINYNENKVNCKLEKRTQVTEHHCVLAPIEHMQGKNKHMDKERY